MCRSSIATERIVANGLAGLWVLGAHWFVGLRSRIMWWAVAFALVVVALEVILGVVVYAAGSPVNLVPKTAYADERIAFIYKGAKLSYFGGTFKNDDPTYYKYARSTTADGEGRFTFTDVPAGSYYITTEVAWMVQYERQGGALMESVTIGDGQSQNVIMSGM